MALRILQRYLLRRWAIPLAGALSFFGGMMLASQVVQTSRDLFAQGAAFRWLIPLLVTSLPEIFGLVLPMAAVLGGLMGTQHLAEGSELVASQGLGSGSRVILKPWAILALLLFGLGTLNAHFLVPGSSRLLFRLQNQMLEEAQTRFLRPGAPPYYPPGSPTHALWVAPSGSIHLMEVTPEGIQHLVAERMSWTRSEDRARGPALTLNLESLSGVRFQRTSGSVLHLRQESLAIGQTVPPTFRPIPPTPVRYLDTPDLIRTWSRESATELSRRLALPLAAGALLLLGIALGFGHPRFHHGGALVKSLMVILGYYLGLKIFENALAGGHGWGFAGLLLLPWVFMAAGMLLLARRLRPHHTHRRSRIARWVSLVAPGTARLFQVGWHHLTRNMDRLRDLLARLRPGKQSHGVLGAWSRGLWWRMWGATLATFLVLNLLIEYASRAGDLSKNGIQIYVFIKFWILNLSNFLGIVLPIVFVFGAVLALGELAVSREWTALKAGGVSLLQLVRVTGGALLLVLAGTFVFQAVLAPRMSGPAYTLHREMRRKAPKRTQSRPWLHLGNTGVLWHLEGKERWGFPLKAMGEGPVLLRWALGEERSQTLPWNGLAMSPGPAAIDLFPDRALRAYARAEETPTLDLFRWQRWAPDPERATLLWSRLLAWLAGPSLLFALLPFAFPAPRAGRGRALGYALVVCLLYLGAQAIFNGAAQAGEVPAPFGVLAPMLLFAGFGFWNLNRIKT
ncbi:MAG TPA: LptF/LptG family permease [Holophaga sp.]|nr:LptF/LptG family permease [Holophaga sp.]